MKKLVFLTVLALFATCVASWGLVVVDESFEYPTGNLVGQGGWAGLNWATDSQSIAFDGAAVPPIQGWTVFDGNIVATSSGGILEVNDASKTSTAGKINYRQTWPASGGTLDNGVGTTITAVLKCTTADETSSTGGIRTQEMTNIWLHDGAREMRFAVLPNRIVVQDVNPANIAIGTLETTTGSFPRAVATLDGTVYHTYVITVKGLIVNIYVDGASKPAIAAQLTVGATDKWANFGTGGTFTMQHVFFDSIQVKSGGAFGPGAFPEVVTSSHRNGAASGRWGMTGSYSLPDSISRTFPVVWHGGSAVVYVSMAMDATDGPSNMSYFLLFDGSHREACRIYYYRAAGTTGEIDCKTGGVVAKVCDANANNTWYNIRLAVNITGKTFSAYYGDGDRSTNPDATGDSTHWTKAVTDKAFADTAADSLASIEWLMYERTNDCAGVPPYYVFMDDLYVNGPDLTTPDFISPADTCGTFTQYRYFTTRPTFTFDVNPHSQYRVKVFTATQIAVGGFNPETSPNTWDSGDVVSTGTTCTVSADLPASNMANPPSNILYVYGKAFLTATSAWGPWSQPTDFVCSGAVVAPNVTAVSVVGAVANILSSTAAPTVTWTATGDWDQYQVKITDTTTGGVYYDSGYLVGASPFAVPSSAGTLTPVDNYRVDVRVRKGCETGNMETGFASYTFNAYTDRPPAVTISAPASSDTGLKPVVEFTGQNHSQIQVKITKTNDPAATGGNLVWDSGQVTSVAFGANCPTAVTAATNYWAWVKIKNPIGWSDWNAVHVFQITRTNEAMTIRHMDETDVVGIGAHVAAPDDTFIGLGSAISSTDATVTEMAACPSGVLRVVAGSAGGGQLLSHNANINLNKGTTVVVAARSMVKPGTENADESTGWKAASILVTDSAGGGAAIKLRPDRIALSLNGTTWPYQYYFATPNNDFHIIRITAKAATYNDPASVTWNVYVDEAASPVITQTGAMLKSTVDPTQIWWSNRITVGQGPCGVLGVWDYDWTAVNGCGAYAPVDWNTALAAHDIAGPGGTARDWKASGNTYTSIAAALAGETGLATINTGDIRINHVHDYNNGSGCYYVQDFVTNANSLKIDAKAGTGFIKGKKVASITGLLSSDGAIKVVRNNPAVTLATTQPSPLVASSPLVMSIKALGGVPCITQLAALGSTVPAYPGPFLDNVGKLVRVFAVLPGNASDPEVEVSGYVNGAQIFYADDLSGTNVVWDGREELPGLRILLDLGYDNSVSYVYGDVLEIVGVSSLDSYLDGTTLKTVRKIVNPTITKIAP